MDGGPSGFAGHCAPRPDWVREVLTDHHPTVVEDVALIASEYVTNCVRHRAASGGETVHLRIHHDGDRVRLEVDAGGDREEAETGWTDEEAADFGRGLQIVARVADEMGDETTASGGHLAWAEMKVRA